MNKNGISRRGFLRGLTLAAGASAVGTNAMFGFSRAFAQDATGTDDDIATVINLAATAELFASTHYLAAINAVESGDLALDDIQLAYLKTAFAAERDHYDLLLSLGAEPVVNEFFVPENLFSDVSMFSEITEVAETVFVNAYLAATRIFTELGEVGFAVTTAQISAVEAEHRALVRQIGMRTPNNISYQIVEFLNVSDAVPTLQPFLDGSADGFVGPVAPPTEEDVMMIRADAANIGYMSDVLPFAAIQASQPEEMTGTTATITARSQNVNIRQNTGTEFPVVGVLQAGQSTTINGQRMGDDGFTWWRVADGGWIRSDTVNADGNAQNVPAV